MYFLKIKEKNSMYIFENENKSKLIEIFKFFLKTKKTKPQLIGSNAFKIENGYNEELTKIIEEQLELI